MRALGSVFGILGALLTFGLSRALADTPAVPVSGCSSLDLEQVTQLHRGGHHVDVHNVTQTLHLLCRGQEVAPKLHLLDALALIELQEHERARSMLARLRAESAGLQETASVLIAWSFQRQGDDQAFFARLATLPFKQATRLAVLHALDHPRKLEQLLPAVHGSNEISETVQAYQESTRTKRPWLAGTLSTFIPGAGQAYAGSWQGAAVAFVLNAVLIGATVELYRREAYLTASAASVAASFFYLGNILNAADLAHRRNEVAGAAARTKLEFMLLPEAHP